METRRAAWVKAQRHRILKEIEAQERILNLCRPTVDVADHPLRGSHSADHGVARCEIDARTGQVASRVLTGLRQGLRLLDTGGYGICEECGGKIAMKRLKALPGATHCIGCAD